MALTFGFYNSLDGDRTYDARQMSSLFDGIIRDGIFMSVGTAFGVTPGTGVEVVVGAGRAWFNHTWTDNDAAMTVSLAAPHATLKRIDVVVLEVNENENVRANSIKVVSGLPSSSPSEPTLTNTNTIHQYPLASILLTPGLDQIAPSHITNKIGTGSCPFITGVLETMPIDDIVAQWESEFGDWFEEMKDQLSTDAAGNLQLQIDAIEEDISGLATLTKDQIADATLITLGEQETQGSDQFVFADASDTNNLKRISFSEYENRLYSVFPVFSDWPVFTLPQMGRLSLSSLNPVTVADVAASSDIYYIPYTGSLVTLHRITDRSIHSYKLWNYRIGKGLSISSLAANKNYDVFIRPASNGTSDSLTELSVVAWTNDTTRAVNIVPGPWGGMYKDSGIPYLPEYRYLGTFRTTNVVGVTTDTAAKRFLWNYEARVPKIVSRSEANGSSWTYNSTTFRYANNNNSNRIEFVCGDPTLVDLEYIAPIKAAASSTYGALISIGENSSTAEAAEIKRGGFVLHNANMDITIPFSARLQKYAEARYNMYTMIEQTHGFAATFYGGSAHGLRGHVMC